MSLNRTTIPNNMLLIEAIKEMGIAPKDKKIVEEKLNAVYKKYAHVDEHAKDEKEDRYPLDYAIEYANPFAVEWLINKFGRLKKAEKINRKKTDKDKIISHRTPFIRSISFSDAIDEKSSSEKKHEIESRKSIIRILVNNGANLWAEKFIENDGSVNSPLYEALKKNNKTFVEIYFNHWKNGPNALKKEYDFEDLILCAALNNQLEYVLKRVSEVTTLWKKPLRDSKQMVYYNIKKIVDSLIEKQKIDSIRTLLKYKMPTMLSLPIDGLDEERTTKYAPFSHLMENFISKKRMLKNPNDSKENDQRLAEAKKTNEILRSCGLTITANDLMYAINENWLDVVKIIVEEYKIPLDEKCSHAAGYKRERWGQLVLEPIMFAAYKYKRGEIFSYLASQFEKQQITIPYQQYLNPRENYPGKMDFGDSIRKQLLCYGMSISEARRSYYSPHHNQAIAYYLSTIQSIWNNDEINAGFYLRQLDANNIQDLKHYFQKRGNEKSNKLLNDLLLKISPQDKKQEMPPATNPDCKLMEPIQASAAPKSMQAPGPLPNAPAAEVLAINSPNESKAITPSEAPVNIIAPGGPQDGVMKTAPIANVSAASIVSLSHSSAQPPSNEEVEGLVSAAPITNNIQKQNALSDSKEKPIIAVAPVVIPTIQDIKKESPASSGVVSLSIFAPATPRSSLSINSASTEGSTQFNLQSSIKYLEDILTLMKIAERNSSLTSELTLIASRELALLSNSLSPSQTTADEKRKTL